MKIVDIKIGAFYGTHAVLECTSFITHIDVSCGEGEHGGSAWPRRFCAEKGVKLMAEIKMDHKISGYECPECGNDEIELGQSFCQDYGEPIEWKEDYE